jgi:hypothetical protein
VHPFWLSPEEKKSLVGALHGRAAMVGLRAPWPAMRAHRRGKGGGEIRAGAGGVAGCGAVGGDGLGAASC